MSRKRIIIGFAVILLSLAIGRFAMRPTGSRRYNVVLISVDTLRPDRLGYAGHLRDTSPAIDGFAKTGVVFTNCRSASGWTLPSMATIFTGEYPKNHGATDVHLKMDQQLATLASLLHDKGYHVRGYVSHFLLRPQYGLDKGFDTYDTSVLDDGHHPHDASTAKPLTDRAIEGLVGISEPFFLWIHYFDPHYEYLSHERWSEYGQNDIDRYDQEIAYTDFHISRLLATLRERNLHDNTIIVFTSDHGEEFSEHGGKYHYTMHEEVVKVPLIIKAPSLQTGVDHSPVEQIGLLPTILQMCDIRSNEPLAGRDILGDDYMGRPVFIERDRPPPYMQRGIVYGNHKLIAITLAEIKDIPPGVRGTDTPVNNVQEGIYMYDLSSDPDEQKNVYDENDPTARKLRAMLDEHFAGGAKSGDEIMLDEDLRDQLESLGYIR